MKRVTLPEVFAALDKHAYRETQALAERLQAQAGVTAEEQAGALYAQGDVAAHEADFQWHGEPTDQYLVAASYLRGSRRGGFPKACAAYATMLYGKTLYRAGKIVACRVPLRQALLAQSGAGGRDPPPVGKLVFAGRRSQADRSPEREFGRIRPTRVVAGDEDPTGFPAGGDSRRLGPACPVR